MRCSVVWKTVPTQTWGPLQLLGSCLCRCPEVGPAMHMCAQVHGNCSPCRSLALSTAQRSWTVSSPAFPGLAR